MDNIQSPAFYVNVSDIYKPIENPITGEDYVKNVVFERNLCPETVTAEINIDKFNKKQNVFVTQLPAKVTSSNSVIPTIEWQTIQEADFSVVRCNIARIYNSKDEWRQEVSLPSVTCEDSHVLWKNFVNSNLPQLSIIFTMNQFTLEYLLDILIDSLDEIEPGHSLPRNCGLWLYAILASLKLPLTPDICSLLRDLARKCQLLRSKLDVNREDLEAIASPLNLFICLIARYFRQGDLID